MTRTRPADAGFSLVEMLVVVAIIGVIASIALPGLLRARLAGDEAAAIGSLRTINSSQATYAQTCGSGFYAPSLSELGNPPLGGGFAAFISPDLASGVIVEKSRYEVTLTGRPMAGAPAPCTALGPGQTATGYQATATSLTPGGRHFAVNTLGTVWQDDLPFAGVPENTAPATGTPIQ